jgi:hypothetical protein
VYGWCSFEPLCWGPPGEEAYDHTRRLHYGGWSDYSNMFGQLRNDVGRTGGHRSRKRTPHLHRSRLSIRMRQTPSPRPARLVRRFPNHIRYNDSILDKRRILLPHQLNLMEVPNRFPNRFRHHHDCLHVRFSIT